MAHEPRPVVLLVEDELFIRLGTADALADGGFVVLEAQDADEALRIVATTSRLDLLFTDVNLGAGLDGLELSRIVEERRPGTRLVITSGQARIGGADLPGSGVFLPKPYRTDKVCDLVRASLAQTGLCEGTG